MGKILNLHLFIPLRENMGNIFNIFLSSVKECWGRFLMEVVQVLVQEVQQEVFEPDQAGRPHEQSGTQQSKDEQVKNPLLVDLSYFFGNLQAGWFWSWLTNRIKPKQPKLANSFFVAAPLQWGAWNQPIWIPVERLCTSVLRSCNETFIIFGLNGCLDSVVNTAIVMHWLWFKIRPQKHWSALFWRMESLKLFFLPLLLSCVVSLM